MSLKERARRSLSPQSTLERYAFSVAAVALAFALRFALTPLAGTEGPFVLFLGAVLVTAVVAGTGPGILALAIGVLLASTLFAVPARHTLSQLATEALLYAIDGIVIVYMTVILGRRERSLQAVNAELRKASEERSRALARVRDAIEFAPDAYFLASEDSRVTDVNQATCRLLGYEREELIGRSIFDFVAPEEHERMLARRTEERPPGITLKTEWILVAKDGTRIPVEASTNAVPGGRWQGFVRDISEARRITGEREALLARERAARQLAESANQQLRESEERFRLTFEEAPVGMALVALDGRYERVNHALCEITGYSEGELRQRTYQSITHPDDLETDVALAEQVARGELPRYQLEKRYIRKDGSVVDVMLSVSLLRGADGTAQSYISQVEDITARKRAVAALQLSEAKFSGIISIASEAIIAVDRDQRITIFNEGAEKIFGYTKEEAMEMSLDRLIPERYREAHNADFEHFAAGPETARTMAERQEVFGLRKNGEEFPAEASIAKVAVGDETVFSVVLRDVTERKRVQAALQDALNARDAVLAIVAHDLRNPLSTIMMQASLLGRDGSAPERRDQTPRHVIERSCTRMKRLIQDLLDVAMVEAGELKIEAQRLSAADLVREAVEAHASLAASSDVALRPELVGDVNDVLGDRHRLLQVLDNLIGNSIKFTPPGGHIVVNARVEGDVVVFAVKDTGKGIAPEHVPHVFEQFWQATTRTRRLGAGLGLPITKGIVEAHGGRIWVESTLGEGATFYFTIPAAPPAGSRAAESKQRSQPIRRTVRTRKGRQPS